MNGTTGGRVTLNALDSNVLVTRKSTSLALSAASFVAELPNTWIVVSRCEHYSDLTPEFWPKGSTVLFCDYLRHQLTRYSASPAFPFAAQLLSLGHTVVVLDDVAKREELDRLSVCPERSYTNLLNLLFDKPSDQACWLALAADCLAYDLPGPHDHVGQLIASAKHLLAGAEKFDPEVFVSIIKQLAK